MNLGAPASRRRVDVSIGDLPAGRWRSQQGAGQVCYACPANQAEYSVLNKPRALLRFFALFLWADLHRKCLGLAVVGLVRRSMHFITHRDVAERDGFVILGEFGGR